MKIALLGYGKMGKEIEKVATTRGHSIVYKKTRNTQEGREEQADIAIDFSSPEPLEQHLVASINAGKPLLVGTTGWNERLPEIKALVENSEIGFLHAPNFSLGIHFLQKIVQQAAKQLPVFGYSIAIHEEHHTEKKDLPSGTALWLGKVCEKEGAPATITASREGDNPGKHEVCFSSIEDTITIKHQAHNRRGFAQGAVLAAEWLVKKKGFFTLDDLLENFYEKN